MVEKTLLQNLKQTLLQNLKQTLPTEGIIETRVSSKKIQDYIDENFEVVKKAVHRDWVDSIYETMMQKADIMILDPQDNDFYVFYKKKDNNLNYNQNL